MAGLDIVSRRNYMTLQVDMLQWDMAELDMDHHKYHIIQVRQNMDNYLRQVM